MGVWCVGIWCVCGVCVIFVVCSMCVVCGDVVWCVKVVGMPCVVCTMCRVWHVSCVTLLVVLLGDRPVRVCLYQFVYEW